MGLDLLVEFEFRTTRPTGVLLGVSSQKMDGLGIEMIDEKVSGSSSRLSSLQFLHCWVVTIHVHFYHQHPVHQPVLAMCQVKPQLCWPIVGQVFRVTRVLVSYSEDIRSLCSPSLQNYWCKKGGHLPSDIEASHIPAPDFYLQAPRYFSKKSKRKSASLVCVQPII